MWRASRPCGLRTRSARSYSALPQPFNIYGMQHTKITGDLLMKIRCRYMERENALAVDTGAAQTQPLPQQMLQFSTDDSLRQQYVSPWGHIRIGRLLEDLDAFAGLVAWAHAENGEINTKPVSMVTASLDHLSLHRVLSPDQDLIISGIVNWVGTSSMEIMIDAYEGEQGRKKQRLLRSLFTMVAIDSSTRKPVPVNKLVPETPEEKARFEQGEENKKRRLAAAATSLLVSPPTPEERLIVHDLFMQSKKTLNYINMSATTQNSLQICQPQERNIANKIFGGYLMRTAAELAFSCAFMYGQSQPVFHALDDITFLRPVEIGALLKLTSQVIYSKGKKAMVEVSATVHDPLKGEKYHTNRFYFSFEFPGLDLKTVMPQTYEEAMLYLEGKRKFERSLYHRATAFVN